MRVLFVAWRHSYFRNFDSVLRELTARGHEVHLAAEEDEGGALVEALAAECRGLTFGLAPGRADDDWSWVASRLRHGLEYLRYQHRMFDDTPMLVERSRQRTPGAYVAAGQAIRRYARWLRRPVSALTRWLERSVPDDPAIRAFIEAARPDVVLITPLITLGSSQIDYLRAARSLGVPTALCVWSWDHLSSKALIRESPDRVFVWNETQKREAVELHDVDPGRVIVTGAQCFDKWFDRAPSRSRAAFCAEVGLPADRPFALYVCSAPFVGSQPEAPFVVDWIRRVRSSGSARLRDLPILVRPHPSRRLEWDDVDLGPYADVALWGDNPVDPQARADYFDSLHHSALVVGLNTSAFIEAAIVGRPVHTILLPEWHDSQMGTVHFRYLFQAGGGLLISATTFDAHLQQLDDTLVHPSAVVKPFVASFVRPHGLTVAATPRFVSEVEVMQGLPVAAPAAPMFERLALRLLRRAIEWRADVERERWVYSEREMESILRVRTFRREKALQQRARKRASEAERHEKLQAREAERERHRETKRAQKQATGAKSPSGVAR
jgi:hypothetical protein